MSFKEKNIVVSLVNFILILLFYCSRIFQMNQNDNFQSEPVFQLFGIVVFLAVAVTVLAIILTHLVPIIIKYIKTGEKESGFDDLEDERDKMIDLRGTKITYTLSSLGSFIAMLAYVYGQPPLVMFTLFIFFGVLSQIIGDASRLLLYRRGF